MSTIRHPIQTHAWWYAAAAAVLLAGLLAVLMATVFTDSGTVGNPTGGILTSDGNGHHAPYSSPCYAGHPGGGMEPVQPGCPAGTP